MRELSPQTRALVKDQIENYIYLSPDEQAREAIRVIARDFYIYCERNLMIKDKRGQMVPLVPNQAQRKLVESVLDDIAHGRPVRYIVLKARQMGLSTIIEALGYWWTTTHRNITSVIIAHEKPAANNLYKMFRRYYDNSHEHFQPDRRYNTKTDLTFDVEENVKEAYRARGERPPGLQSEIKTMVAKEGGGRSDTIIFFHGSEVAFWDSSADVVSSALQAVPLLPGTFAFLESTANGVGNYFYNEWQYAKKGESSFKPFFFPWHEHLEYMIEGRIEVYDEEELELLEIFENAGYPREQWDWKLIWRREKRKEFRADPSKFYQEYPKDDMEAFLASGRPVFNIRRLINMERVALGAEPPTYGILREVLKENRRVLEFEAVPVQFQDQDPTPLKIWEAPKKDGRYVIGVDVSEGIASKGEDSSGDFSVMDVMDAVTLKTVARWRGHIDPDLLGIEAMLLGKFYNNALIGVEVNNHGISTVQQLRDRFYRNLYMRETSDDQLFQERTTKMGWRTDRKTKPVMINELVAAVREGDIVDLDITFIRECMTYVRDDNGHTAAQLGMFDDCVMAKAISLQMAQWQSYDLESARDYIRKPKKRNADAEDSSNQTVIKRRRESRFAARRRGSRG